MIGIKEIASHIPEMRVSNFDRKEKFGISDQFIEEKIGVRTVAVKEAGEEASDLCIKAYRRLLGKTAFDPAATEALVVVTQNPDFNIPHVSAIVHGKLDLPLNCACFDISLGCSGYVYALSVVESFMRGNGMRQALIFTADPYSKIVDPEDKNTTLLFGDGASVTLLGESPRYTSGKFTFGTSGKDYRELICQNGKLYMNGRAVFNFVAKQVSEDIKALVSLNGLTIADIDCFVLHQGSRHMIEFLKRRLELPCQKVPYVIHDYGNTVSSSIPLALESELERPVGDKVLISGFGVGFSWSGGILTKV